MGTLIRLAGDRRVFVAGMYWRHEDRYPARKTLKEGARNTDFLVAVRRTQSGAIQSGFTEPVLNEDGRQAGKPFKGKMYSLAAAVAEVLQEPWQGVFDLGDGRYWYIAVRENYEVLPDGDFIGDYDAVDKRMREHAAYDAWRLTVNGGVEKILELVAKSVKQKPVRDIRKNAWIPVLVGGGVAGAAIIGGMIYWNHVDEQIERAKQAEMLRHLAVEHAMMERRALADVPWLKLAKPSAFLGGCAHGASSIPLSNNGWLLDTVTCAQMAGGAHQASQHLVLIWKWSAGATMLAAPAGIVSHQGSEIVQQVSEQPLPASRNGVLLSAQAALRRLYGLAQITHVGIHVSPLSLATPSSGLPGEPAHTPAHGKKLWTVFTISMHGPLGAIGGGEVWNTLPGLRLTRVTYPVMASNTAKNGVQMITVYGDLYVRNTPDAGSPPSVTASPHEGRQQNTGKEVLQGVMHAQP